MSDDFIKRNEIRKRQIQFANDDWTRTVGDKVQLRRDFGGLTAWTKGEIITLEMKPYNAVGMGLYDEFTTVQFEDGTIITDYDIDKHKLPIVPDEDYFSGEESL